MSKQCIRTVREFNQWLNNTTSDTEKLYPSGAIDRLIIMAERYEKLRKLNPNQYAALCERNLAGEGTFDDLVDKLR